MTLKVIYTTPPSDYSNTFLTLGKTYDAEEIPPDTENGLDGLYDFYTVVNDAGTRWFYNKSYFTTISDIRNNKLTDILP